MSSTEDQLADYAALGRRVADLAPEVDRVAALLIERLAGGGTVYSLGNGGSAADAQHLTGELAGHFRADRRALRAVTIGADPVLLTAIGNDYAFDDVFSRPLSALAGRGDVVCAFTTSGESCNVVGAIRTARERGATTVAFVGGSGGRAARLADHVLLVPSGDTARIQEVHTLFIHLISDRIDAWAAA